MTTPQSRRAFCCHGAMAFAFALATFPAAAAKPLARKTRYMALDELDFHQFASELNKSFRVSAEGIPAVDLVLIEAEQHSEQKAERAGAAFERFSLVFAGTFDVALPQQIYHFENARLGRFDLFMVPIISRDPERFHYQVIFNRAPRRPAAQSAK